MTGDDNADKAHRHQRIAFRREEVVDLSALPSSAGQTERRAPKNPSRPAANKMKRPRSWMRRLGYVALGLVALIGVAVALVAYAISSGWGAERLRLEAERSLERQFGKDLDVRLADVRLSLLGPGLINFALNGIMVRDTGANADLLKADTLKFGIEVRPLLSGKLLADSVEVSTARVNAVLLPASGDGETLRAIFNPQGIVEPDLLLAGAFDAADSVVKTFGAGGAPAIVLDDFEIALGPGLPIDRIAVHRAELTQSGQQVALEGAGAFGSREVTFSATADRAERKAPVDAFHLEFRSGNQLNPTNALALGDTLASITADRRAQAGKPNLRLSLGARSFSLDLGTRGQIAGSLNLAAVLEKGSSKIEIERLNADVGQSRFRLNGAVGPTPRAVGETGPPTYRYEFISNDAVLSPADTPDPPMPMSLRIAGQYQPRAHRLAVDELSIASDSGMASGTAALQFDGLKPPGIDLNLGVKDLSVADVKKLWPWIAAESTRRWVIANLSGGRVPEGGIRLAIAAGRLGDGRRLDQNEVSGQFKVDGAEVTTAGQIPHIQNAIGEVKFAGDDVDITLDSGRAEMSGGVIQARAGVLTVRDAGTPPVYGDLNIEVSGSAKAIAELANAEPMSALRTSGIDPQSLSGSAQGKVHAVIPIATHGDRSRVDWKVDLAFDDLRLSKPFQGQMISKADGTLVVDRSSAIIRADALLSGVPAKLEITEPIGANSPVRRMRKATIALDQNGLDRLAPGLKSVVGGALKAEIDASNPSRTSVRSDLGGAALTIPGLGWTKGKGIPATLSFDVATQNGATQVTNLRLAGASFGMSGQATIAGGALTSARFDKVELSRGDNFRVDIERRGGAYSISASGDALDGRGLIKQATTARQGRAQGGGGPDITLKANIRTLTGFNDETLTGVRLDVDSGGRGDISLEGKTRNGKPVSIATRRGGDISVYSEDAGDLLRFLNIYPRVEGGLLRVKLRALKGGAYAGDIDLDRFWVVNEPKLDSLVSSAPSDSRGSLNKAVKGKIDTKRARFERGHVSVELGTNYLRFVEGVLRGPELGATFKGTAYDAKNIMSLTGTFMPAYGLNSVFGDIPVLGALLGNGDEKGLIGVTYKLTGNAKSPRLQVNPLSIVAPGIFRSIFEYQ